MESGGLIPIYKDSLINLMLNRTNPIPGIDIYFFKIDCNIVFSSTPRPS